ALVANEDGRAAASNSTVHVERFNVNGLDTRLTVEAPLEGFDDRIGALAREAVIFGVVVLAVSVIAALILARHLSRRINSISRGAARFAAGDLRHRIPQPPSTELASLCGALNEMAAQLSTQITMLRTQRNEQEGILRSMEGGVVAISADQRILRMNRAARRLLGVEETDVRGKNLSDIVREGAVLQFAADAIADPTRRSQEFQLTTPTDAVVRATSGALLDAEDEPVGAILLLDDVTQIRRLESMRSDFAANVSHELRTPITNIKGYTETLLETDAENVELRLNFLKVIARNAERLGAIVDDMLALTNLERTDGGALPTSPTAAWLLVDNVRQQLGPDAEAKKITLETDVPRDLRVQVNPRLAEQALVNLVSNAVKYSPEVTKVTISAGPSQLAGGRAGVEFLVADEGPGISPDHLPRLFERFYRVDKARSREEGGTGLGLA
ncbi:MAG: histidine kinase dimerization/phospho-acceptor domain-containing protein, partial [Planctomycetota bacterium]